MPSKGQHLLPATLPALGLLLAGTFIVLAPHDARATFPGHNGRIAFEGSRSGPSDIYVVNANGSHKRNLTQSPGSDLAPAFSANGKRIVFERFRPYHHNTDLYVMNADGSHRHRLTHGPWSDFAPCFSPSGRRIVFASTRNGKAQIYKMHANGSHQRPLTHHPGRDYEPTFSPDGRKIAFASSLAGETQIYKMNTRRQPPAASHEQPAPAQRRVRLLPRRREDRLWGRPAHQFPDQSHAGRGRTPASPHG